MPLRWQRRLAVIGGENPGEALRLSRAEMARVAALRAAAGGLLSPAALGWTLGPEAGEDAVLARAALMESPLPPDWQADVARGAAARFPVVAADLMPALSGVALGTRLKELETLWLRSDLRLTRAQLLA